MKTHPFEDTEEKENLLKLRAELILSLDDYDIEDTEKRFILRKINHITEKLLEKNRYSKDLK